MLDTLRHRLFKERHALAMSACLTAAVCGGLYSSESHARPHDAPVIYPVQARAITFSHGTHKQAECATCHDQVASSASSADTHTPTMQACASCHTQTSPKLEQCAACHIHYDPKVEHAITTPAQWQAVSPPPLIPGRTQASLKFSHKAHAGEPCASCHDTSQRAATLPSMASCMSCHDGATASKECATCHTREQVTRHALTKTEPAQAPPSMLTQPHATPPPSSHAHDWLDRHGVIALTQSEDCMSCHTETSCASCHNARSGQPLAAHPPNYLIEHRLSARLAEQNCTDCHRQEASCQACHTRSLAAPASDTSPGPPASVDFHPPTWLDTANTNNHGVMARRNINECASCHQERDCISCHQGISPHPPEFALNCSRILKKNPISCTKCHTQSGDALCPSM